MLRQESEDRFVQRTEVLQLTSIRSPSTLYDLIKTGQFPRPYKITRGRKAWSFLEIQTWIGDRKKVRG
jgi:predicted DNA-binding transcriptional regulator AlpA